MSGRCIAWNFRGCPEGAYPSSVEPLSPRPYSDVPIRRGALPAISWCNRVQGLLCLAGLRSVTLTGCVAREPQQARQALRTSQQLRALLAPGKARLPYSSAKGDLTVVMAKDCFESVTQRRTQDQMLQTLKQQSWASGQRIALEYGQSVHIWAFSSGQPGHETAKRMLGAEVRPILGTLRRRRNCLGPTPKAKC